MTYVNRQILVKERNNLLIAQPMHDVASRTAKVNHFVAAAPPQLGTWREAEREVP